MNFARQVHPLSAYVTCDIHSRLIMSGKVPLNICLCSMFVEMFLAIHGVVNVARGWKERAV